MAYLQPAAYVILPWAEKRIDRLLEAGVEHVESLHCNSIIETKAAIVIVQVHTDTRRVPVVSEGNATIFHIGVESVLQTEAPVSCGWSETDKALSVAALSRHPQVPHSFVPHVYFPVVLAAGVLGCGEDSTEPVEAARKIRLLAANPSLLHFGVKV